MARGSEPKTTPKRQRNPDAVALIPAGGMGTRLGLGPKALLKIGEHTLLQILVQTLVDLVDRVVIAAPTGYERQFEALLSPYSPDEATITVIAGGRTRQDSIDRLVDACSQDLLLIQDVARPFAPYGLCGAVLQQARLHGAAAAFLDPGVPVGRLHEGRVGSYWERDGARIFQAPQAFRRKLLVQSRSATAGRDFQSTAQMVISAGHVLQAVEGTQENLKVTTPFDWLVAQRVVAPSLGLV